MLINKIIVKTYIYLSATVEPVLVGPKIPAGQDLSGKVLTPGHRTQMVVKISVGLGVKLPSQQENNRVFPCNGDSSSIPRTHVKQAL